MTIKRSFLLTVLLSLFPTATLAQDVGRVSPAALPVPLSSTVPMPPDKLRAHNPWTLAMTGQWRFQLTRGHIVAGEFLQDQSNAGGISASSNETLNVPLNAFDGRLETRWCADGPAYPQWLQADLEKPRQVVSVNIAWERSSERFRTRIEGSQDGKHWKILSDASASPGIGDGPIAIPNATVRYLRVVVLGTNGTGWASIRECQIGTQETDNSPVVTWRPPAPRPVQKTDTDAFASLTFDDAPWNNIPVPSNWEVLGYSVPTYNSVDNTVGQYRRWVSVPASWDGKRVYWHFDGVLDGAEIYVNGKKAGYHESGYTAFDVDLTGLVHPGERNLFAVRVSKTTPSSDCETGDYQCMGGIYRETFLTAVPETHLSDITVRTPLATNYQDATLETILQVQGKPGDTVEVTGKLYGADGKPADVPLTGKGTIDTTGNSAITLSALVKSPKLWSAEKPNLYYVVFDLSKDGKSIERVEQRFGFRQVEIKENVVLWNGRPIKCTGVCRHDFWANKGFALTDQEWLKDIALIKSANINAIRTSHYNHAARFLELCEEKGIYILDEVPYCWIGDQVKDLLYAPYLLQRAAETLARDKNRPCVLAWSLGNENPNGQDSQLVMDLVKKADPTRPAFVSQMNPNDIKGQAWEDDHYPQPGYVDEVAKRQWGANFSEHPHIFYQKETQEYDPGASDLWSETMIKTWDKLWKSPTILGSFIWEWQNQGIADKNPDHTRDFYYGQNYLRQENNKGIVSAYRVPKPEWWIVKMVYSPVAIQARTLTLSNDGTWTVPILNHYSFTDLKELDCRWTAYAGTHILRSGLTHIDCAPGQTVQASFPLSVGMTHLHLEFDRPDGTSTTSVVSANLAVGGPQVRTEPAPIATGTPLTIKRLDPVLTIPGEKYDLTVRNNLQTLSFDANSGEIAEWRVRGHLLLKYTPTINLGESKASDEKGFYHVPQDARTSPPLLVGTNVTLETDVNGIAHATVHGSLVDTSRQDRTHLKKFEPIVVTNDNLLGYLTLTYLIKPDAEIQVNWKLDWIAADTHLWEAGLKFILPADLTQMTWSRDSYFTDYPTGHIGEPSGTANAGTPLFAATKRALHWMTLTDKAGDGFALLTANAPLVGRCSHDASGSILYASAEVAGPIDFSGSWVANHDIVARKGSSLTGAFILRAISGKR